MTASELASEESAREHDGHRRQRTCCARQLVASSPSVTDRRSRAQSTSLTLSFLPPWALPQELAAQDKRAREESLNKSVLTAEVAAKFSTFAAIYAKTTGAQAQAQAQADPEPQE